MFNVKVDYLKYLKFFLSEKITPHHFGKQITQFKINVWFSGYRVFNQQTQAVFFVDYQLFSIKSHYFSHKE